MAGFGQATFGLSPFGTGTPAEAPVQGGSTLKREDDYRQTGSRKIDASTRDYVFDSFGRIAGMGNAQQLVMLASLTEQGTASLRTLGHQLRSVDRITPSMDKRIESIIETAFAPLTTRRLVQIVSVESDRESKIGARVRVRWRDLTSNQEQDTFF